MSKSFRKEVRALGAQNKSPDTLLKEIEQRMLTLQSMTPGIALLGQEEELQLHHDRTLQMLEFYWHQRSRVNWAVFGDRNSKFFHAMAITRRRKNTIQSIQQENGEWITSDKEIKSAFVAHFYAIYQAEHLHPITAIVPPEVFQSLPKVSPASLSILTADPSEQEIKSALFSLGPDKAPGPNGLNAKVLQEQWNSFGPAILAEVRDFFQSSIIHLRVARSNLVLIPKMEDATKVTQFRPISVCNVIYRVISKVLARRMRPHLAGLISINQGAFVLGHLISDNVILLREALHSFNQKGYKRANFCFKADLSKAFDRMDWQYLQDLLLLYGFPDKFTAWIMSCVRSAEFTLVVNGRGDGFLRPTRGLR